LLVSFAVASCGGAETPPPAAPPGVCAPGPVASTPTPGSAAQAAALPPPSFPETDEGMWLFNGFPADRVQKRHGFAPDKAWLDHVRLSAVRLAGGCSGSVVSPNGLVMTNHHCAEACIQQLSTPKKDFMAQGFSARSEADEVKCPEIELNQLTDMTDVTERISAATKGLSGAAFHQAMRAEKNKIEKECATGDTVRCDVVDLYHGGLYHLYKYRRFQDVRLVFAPEFPIAFFGGDPDNFNFPRYDLDMSFLRIYENGKPLHPDHYLKWSKDGAKEGDLTFVAGHPGRTDRQLTIAQLENERDFGVPWSISTLAQSRGEVTEFSARGKEQRRVGRGRLFGIENGLKVMKGRLEALVDKDFFGQKVAEERDLRARVDANPELKAQVGGAWDAIAAAQKEKRNLTKPYALLEGGRRGAGAFDSALFAHARTLVRAAAEKDKPNDKRLPEYGEAKLPAVKMRALSTAPVYEDLEIVTLGASLVRLREELGPDHPIVKKVLGKDEPRELAARLVKGSKLADLKTRKALFEGGKATVDASKDPMIVLAKLIDDDARAVRTAYEDKVEAVETAAGELIAKARFAVYGTSVYPDATFTLRLSFGKVAGWEEAGQPVAPFTTMGGAFERHTGKEPFALPASWLAAKDKLDPKAPFDFVTTNDIIGGNSGSPMVDKNGEVVGLVFDGNIHSLGGDYGYEPKNNRTVSVHSSAIVTALDKVYGQSRLVSELKR
jgi:hypothetical protein